MLLEERYKDALFELDNMKGYSRINKGYAIHNISHHSIVKGILIHRFIASKVFNRELNGRKEVVHHLDGNSFNNHYTNLMILKIEDHTILHKFLSKYPQYYGLTQCETLKLLDYIKDYREFLDGNIVHDLDVYENRIATRMKSGNSYIQVANMKSKLSKIRRRRAKVISSKTGKTKKSFRPSKEELISLMKEYKGKIKDIAYSLGYVVSTVSRWCSDYGIDRKEFVPGYNSTLEKGICPICGKEFRKRHGEQQIYCSKKCAERRVTSGINEYDAYALWHIFKKSFREIGRIFDRDHEVMSRLIRKTEPEWNALSNEKKLEVIERVSDKYLK